MKSKGMKSAKMPSEHSEKSEGQLNPTCSLKYGSEMGNPGDLDKNSAGLANYVKKNKMKY
jgi:hypothetical protein